MQPNGIAAVVNDQVITFSEVKREVDPTERLLRETYSGEELASKIKEARLNALDGLIRRQLILQDFKTKGFFIPENIIEDRLKRIVDDKYDGDRMAFIKTLQATGMSLEAFKKDLMNQTIILVMRSKHINQAVIVSPYRVEQYYQDNIRQFVQPEAARVRMIYLKRSLFLEKRTDEQGKEIEIDPNEAVAKEILYKLDTGSKFADLARSYSEGPKRTEGGDIGWVTKETLRPEISKEVFRLRPGQTSRIISVPDGFYIIRVEDVKRASVQPISEVREQIEKLLLQEEKQRLEDEWIGSLRTKAFIKIF